MGQSNASYELIIKSHKISYNTQGRFTDQRLQGGIPGLPNESFFVAPHVVSVMCWLCQLFLTMLLAVSKFSKVAAFKVILNCAHILTKSISQQRLLRD